MKHCPHCKHVLTYFDFVTRYGSDTLIRHPAAGHSREHICLNCRHKIWIHYKYQAFRDRVLRYLVLDFLAAGLLAGAGIKPWLGLSELHTLILMVILMILMGPVFLSFAKYESVVLKEEKP